MSDAERSDAVARLIEKARIGLGMTLVDELDAWLEAEFSRTGYEEEAQHPARSS